MLSIFHVTDGLVFRLPAVKILATHIPVLPEGRSGEDDIEPWAVQLFQPWVWNKMSQLDRGYLIDEQFVKWCKPPTNKMSESHNRPMTREADVQMREQRTQSQNEADKAAEAAAAATIPPKGKQKAAAPPSKSELFIQEYKGVYGLAAILDAMDLLNIKTGWSEEDSSIDDLSDKDIVKLGWYLVSTAAVTAYESQLTCNTEGLG